MAKYVALGELIRLGRQHSGLDQDELAARLDIGQQAVSGWERGVSRPRHSQLPDVCQTLGLDLEAATEAGRYRESKVTSSLRMLTLPFENLTDEAFEAFCADLLAFSNPHAKVSRNGSTGQKQFGVDVYVDGAEGRIGVQCKRRENFGPANVRSVVKELLPEANVRAGIIALSRHTASAATRREIGLHPDWTLLDGEDLSRAVRELPDEKALRLVDTYFAGLRELFLGIREPSPWLTLAEFDPGLPGRLAIDRDFTMVGRADQLRQLRELAEARSPLILLVGRGGIGKTRLLREFATSDSDREVRFVRPRLFSPQDFEVLPGGDPVIVIDDATDEEHDLLSLVTGITSARPDATVVFSTRPRSLPHLRAKFEIAEQVAKSVTIELGDLAVADAEALASEALGELSNSSRVEGLGRVGYDCPFLIVIAAHLMRAGQLSDRELGSQGTLRQLILDRFASIHLSGPKADEWTRVLAAVAAVQPAPLDDPQCQRVIAGLARAEVDHVISALDELEDLGMILRRKQTVRVVPDLLGDSILDRALVSETGLDKGFATRIADCASGRLLTNAIRNVSIIDWRKRTGGPSELALVLWSALTRHALSLPNSERIALASSVAQVAAVYPNEALNLVDELLTNPAPDEEDQMARILGEAPLVTTEAVHRALAPLISNAGHHQEHLGRAIPLLLGAGRNDARRENNSPDHAMRLLRELGDYSSGQSVQFYVAFAENVAEILDTERDVRIRSALLGMLQPLLAVTFTVTRSRGVSLTVSRHNVDLDRVAPVRSAVLSIGRSALAEGGPVATSAVQLLGAALISQDRTDEPTDEFVGVVATLRALLSSAATHPGLRLAAYRALGWHATYGQGSRRRLSREARSDLLRDDAYIIARQVRSGWDADEDDESDDNEEAGTRAVTSYYRASESNAVAVDDLVDRWIALGDELLLLERVRQAVRDEVATGAHAGYPDRLVHRLMTGAPHVARSVLSNASNTTNDDAALVELALRVLLEVGDPDVENQTLALLNAEDHTSPTAASAIVNARNAAGGVRERLIRHASGSKDSAVHRILISAGRWFEPEETSLLLELLQVAPIESDPQVAADAITLLAYGRRLPWTSLPSPERTRLLGRLAKTPRLPDHELGVLLNAEIREDPWAVIAFLKTRVDEKGASDSYDVFPYLKAVGLDFAESPQLPLLIDDVVEWVLGGDQWLRGFYGEQLLNTMLSPYGEEAKALICRLIASRDEGRLRLARTLLGQAPQTFVVDEPQFVTDLLELARLLPDELAQHVTAGLHGSAYIGMRSRSVGIDDPSEVELRDRGRAIAAAHPEGSQARSFYEDVTRFAGKRLIEERADDRRLEDPRRW